MFKRKQKAAARLAPPPCPPEHRFKITVTPMHDESLVFRGYRWMVNDFGKTPTFIPKTWDCRGYWYSDTYRGPTFQGPGPNSTVKTEELARKEAERVIQRIKDQEGRQPVVIGVD